MDSIVINGNTELYGIIGNPVGHSFSPEMHTLAFQYISKNAIYIPFLVEEEHLPSVPTALSILGVSGFNVTVPFKESIVPYLNELSAEAQFLGSVNTVTYKDGKWIGHSTDGSGFVRSAKVEGLTFRGKKVLLYGGGGSARAVAAAISKEGISSLCLVNRTRNRAEKIAELIKENAPQIEVVLGGTTHEEFDILINCTSVGLDGEECAVPNDQIKRVKCVIDIVYNPPKTPLIKKAEVYGIPTFNGLGMLLYQAIEAFEIWTGEKAPVEVMDRSLRRSMYKSV